LQSNCLILLSAEIVVQTDVIDMIVDTDHRVKIPLHENFALKIAVILLKLRQCFVTEKY